MEHFFLYAVLILIGIGYAISVISCALSGPVEVWWEPFLMAALLPFALIYQHKNGIAFLGAAAFSVWVFVWICIGCAHLFRWAGSLL